MADAAFEELLTETAEIERPVVELDAEGGPTTPEYEPTGESVRVRIADACSFSDDGLLGRTEDVTHVVYSTMGDVRAADRLVTRPVETVLADDVEAGQATLPVESTEGMRDGQEIELGSEELTITAVAEGELSVTPATSLPHEAGESVAVVVGYEVMEVEDEAGAGHHLRMTARVTGRR